jgi:hypothetical protein
VIGQGTGLRPRDRSCDRNDQHRAALVNHPANAARPRCAVRSGTCMHLLIAGSFPVAPTGWSCPSACHTGAQQRLLKAFPDHRQLPLTARTPGSQSSSQALDAVQLPSPALLMGRRQRLPCPHGVAGAPYDRRHRVCVRNVFPRSGRLQAIRRRVASGRNRTQREQTSSSEPVSHPTSAGPSAKL